MGEWRFVWTHLFLEAEMWSQGPSYDNYSTPQFWEFNNCTGILIYFVLYYTCAKLQKLGTESHSRESMDIGDKSPKGSSQGRQDNAAESSANQDEDLDPSPVSRTLSDSCCLG